MTDYFGKQLCVRDVVAVPASKGLLYTGQVQTIETIGGTTYINVNVVALTRLKNKKYVRPEQERFTWPLPPEAYKFRPVLRKMRRIQASSAVKVTQDVDLKSLHVPLPYWAWAYKDKYPGTYLLFQELCQDKLASFFNVV